MVRWKGGGFRDGKVLESLGGGVLFGFPLL